MLRASALTFATILTLVPFLVIMFTMIQFFDLEKSLSKPVSDILQKSAQSVSFKKDEPAAEDLIETNEGDPDLDAPADGELEDESERPDSEGSAEDNPDPNSEPEPTVSAESSDSGQMLPTQSEVEPENKLLTLFIGSTSDYWSFS